MIILGISAFFHDSSACLIKDGIIMAAAEEERFTRKKHDLGFPFKAIEYCLKECNASINDVNYIAYYEKPILKFERILRQFLESFPMGYIAFYRTMPSWVNEKLRVRHIIKRKLKFKGNVFFIDHHLAHAASSYLMSPFGEAAILIIDGVGEMATTSLGYAKGNEIILNKEINFPHSLGLLYSTFTVHLGYKANDHEYRVMGLAAYGKPVYYDRLKKLINICEDGSYKLNMDYFVYHYKMSMPSKKFIDEFGSIRKKNEEITQRHKDLAASVQKLTEELLFLMANNLHKTTGMKNLCLAGGVALNSVANGKILRNTQFENIYIQPAAGDGGTSIGAAAYTYYSILKNDRYFVLNSASLGPSYSNAEIKVFLEKNGINYNYIDDEKNMIKKVAKMIYESNVIGWFQGRMEFGPRALGNRSILSNPCNPKMQEILNLKVKHREGYRPFAPVICAEDAKDYFECDKKMQQPSDFMLMVYPIKKNKQKLIPAVVHVDGSGRLQTINRKQNSRYYDLIKEFGKLSKIPILINTSFNIRGEPIVCKPEDAYKCMMGTGIDYLVIGNFIIARKDNLKNAWNSEDYIND